MPIQNTHYLFICAANQNRSRAAEQICSQLAQKKNKSIHCESAGVDPMAVKRVTKAMADRADTIFVMETYMKTILENEFNQSEEKIVCLDIPDVYPLHDPALEQILKENLAPYI